MKTLNFRQNLSELIRKGEKTTTWRLFDDKDLTTGDMVVFAVWETKQPFAEATLTSVREVEFGKLAEKDWEGHERFASEKEMYDKYSLYYNTDVGPETKVKIINFVITKYLE